MDNETLSSLASEITIVTYENNSAIAPYRRAHLSVLSTLSVCDSLGILTQVTSILAYIGVQEADVILDILHNATIVFMDLLAFIVVIRQAWGLWKLKSGIGLQSNEDLVTLLLRQEYQPRLSSLLICEFTLDLRQRSSKRPVPNQSALDLTTLSFQHNHRHRPLQSVRSVLGRLHESIITEIGESNDPMDSDGPVSGESDDLHNVLQIENLDTI
ncbi:hypothetical protein Clacol_004500 [Clathrus columnatus]|uniref:Uncharacterized protein n=1 Tax=Clathrus columnatus TaxID=1419009 RepID=A0AAV5A6M1_9AGAM|nr:hypothetical protein Clacol_004500 [Clathrus columnatus]